MRLTQKKIEEIMLKILGEEGLPLIKELAAKDNISEFELANKVKKDIKVIRKMLYLLYNHNLVSFTRKKDKIKGWYIYYWTLLPDSIKYSYFKMRREQAERLKEQLSEEKKELFFVCPNNCIRLNFDQGMDFEFHCPECGELISLDRSEEKIAALYRQVKEVERELAQQKQEHKEENKTQKKKQAKKNKNKPLKKKTKR